MKRKRIIPVLALGILLGSATGVVASDEVGAEADEPMASPGGAAAEPGTEEGGPLESVRTDTVFLPPPRLRFWSVGLDAGQALGGLLSGSLGTGVSVERVLGLRHGIQAEVVGSRGLTEGWIGGASYRYHLAPGMESRFIGVFVRFQEVTTEFEHKSKNYLLETSGATAGVQYGSTSIWKSGFTVGWRVGLGYPWVDVRWVGAPLPESPGPVRKLTKFSSALDGALQIGWSF